jgi:hypothetical protein
MNRIDYILNHPGITVRHRWAAGICCLLLVAAVMTLLLRPYVPD